MAESDLVEQNDRIWVLPHEVAGTLERGGMIHRCLDCDAAGHEFHLDPDHAVAELLAAGASPWTPAAHPSKVAMIRLPIFNERGIGR